jgi:hypothetical protein
MIKVKFTHCFFGEEFKVIASAKDVDAYGAINLKLKLIDKQGESADFLLDRETLEDLQEKASELLYERKYSKELEF